MLDIVIPLIKTQGHWSICTPVELFSIFWGGIDTQKVLPRGTEDAVRREVKRMMDILGKNGGYILSAIHNIQADVPPENIVDMFDEAYAVNNAHS